AASGAYLADDVTGADAGEIGERRRLMFLAPRQDRATRIIKEYPRADHRDTRKHACRSPDRHATPPGRRDANRRENDVRRGGGRVRRPPDQNRNSWIARAAAMATA